MRIDDLLSKPGAWLSQVKDSGIVVSSRVRLARNIKDIPFPGWASEEDRDRLWRELREYLESMEKLGHPLASGMEELDQLDKQVLFERHLISREHLNKEKGSGLVVTEDESLAIMVNEEDHLRLQAIQPGIGLKEAWSSIDGVDSELERHVGYSFSANLGYLTACPSNVGTGMRASVMLHVPGLVLMEEINPIIKGMGKIGLAVRGLWGEGTEATGNMFQVSNQITLGDREEDIIKNLEQIVLEIVEHEKNARARLLENKKSIVEDHVGRAYGILTNAHILTSKEALDLLSGLRLGIDLGILNNLDRKLVNQLLILTQPGHLQKIELRKLKPAERDESRARLVREKLLETTHSLRKKTRNA